MISMLKRSRLLGLALSLFTLSISGNAIAGNVAIVDGSFYTPNLANSLTTAGHTVTVVLNYTAVELEAYDAIVQDGNSFTDMDALRTYATGGGTVIFIPWTSHNFSVPADLQVMDNASCATHSLLYPGVTVLEPGSSLLTGVTFPPAGGFDIGRVCTIQFVAEATSKIADWADANSAFLGTRTVGAGQVIHLNMHLITSDTAYEVIDQDWATTLVSNMIDGGAAAADDIARFNVTKTYTDGNTAPVDVTLTCNGGLPLTQSFTIDGEDPAGVTFVVTDIEPGVTNCSVTESGGPDGYTAVYNNCSWTGVSPGVHRCVIENQADPGEFTVTKEWIVSEEGGGDDFVESAIILIACDSEILDLDGGIGVPPAGLEAPAALDLAVAELTGDGSLTALVDTSAGPTSCTAIEATELDPTLGVTGVEVSNGCPSLVDSENDITDPSTWLPITAGGSAECTITNTVFFEGIPSLNQYGLAIMALLMLGMGMVGFRRFA